MPGPNRFDDPRPNTRDRFLVRYAATSLRGSLLELLAAFRPNDEARAFEDDVQGDKDLQPDPDSQLRQALADFLADRQLAVMTPRARTRFVSIDDPGLQAELDREPGVRALLDGPDGRLALMPIGGARPRLDGAAVRLGTAFGRDLTQHCSLAVRDRTPVPAGIHYRSRHDDNEDCWAIYDHVNVAFHGEATFEPTNPTHKKALSSVADLWSLPLPDEWL